MYTDSKDGAVFTIAYKGFDSDVYMRRMRQLHTGDALCSFDFMRAIGGACNGSCEPSSKGEENFVFPRIENRGTTQAVELAKSITRDLYTSSCSDSQDRRPEERCTVGATLAIQAARCTYDQALPTFIRCEECTRKGQASFIELFGTFLCLLFVAFLAWNVGTKSTREV